MTIKATTKTKKKISELKTSSTTSSLMKVTKLPLSVITRYIYIRPVNATPYLPKKQPVGCLAYRAIPILKDNQIEGYYLEYGLSTHNPKDKFDRARGRKMAESRMTRAKEPLGKETNHTHGLFKSKEVKIENALSDLFGTLVENELVTCRLRKCFKGMSRYFYLMGKDYTTIETQPLLSTFK